MTRAVLALTLLVVLFACGCQTAQPLFNGKDLAGWVEVGSKGSWSVEQGVLKCNGQKAGYAWLSTDRKYADVELTVDWRIQDKGNSGVFLRAPAREGRTSQLGFEIQMKDDREDKDLTDVSGAVFTRIPAAGRFAKPPGEWNHSRITIEGRQLRIEFNGHLVSDTHIDQLKPADPAWAMTKVPNEGFIGLQNHGTPAEFRSITIRKLR